MEDVVTLSEIDEATRGQINARRNYLIGLWAGRMIGLSDDQLPRYVREVMLSDYQEPGPQDVVRKVSGDLCRSGYTIGEAEVLRQLQSVERGVRAELLTTD